MLRKIFLWVLFVLITIGYGQSLRDAINNNSSDKGARLVPKLLSYQGYLTDAIGSPITNDLDMKFRILDALTSGSELWYETQYGVSIVDGVFHVLLGDSTVIPDSVFTTGTDRWLELILGTSDTLSPRTRITAMGYAYMATHADTAEYAKAGPGVADNDWVRGGTGDTVLFTANYLGIARGGVNNVLYGDYVYTHINFGVACTTGHSTLHERYTTVGGGYGNRACREYTTVSGGYSNRAFYHGATVAGGYDNNASGEYSAIGGGYGNSANNDCGVVAGGWGNTAGRSYSAIGGGVGNQTDGLYSVISGGYQNHNAGHYSAISGGYADTIVDGADYSYLFGIGSILTEDSTFMVDMPHIRFGDETDGYEFPTIDGDSGQILYTDGNGQLDWTDTDMSKWVVTDSVLYTNKYWGLARGSADNVLYGSNTRGHINLGVSCTTGTTDQDRLYITIGGGYGNTATNNYATIAGGLDNRASASCFVGGGKANDAGDIYTVIAGGHNGTVSSRYSGILAGYANVAGDVWSDTAVSIAGGWENKAIAKFAFVGGGRDNFIEGDYSAILGGCGDTITADADYSYLFGVGSKLTQDSTFMVDMPHIRFGDEASGYEFPVIDGSADQVMITDGSGQLSWIDVPSDTDWVISGSDMYANVSGNVGIGVTSPSEDLEIQDSDGQTGITLNRPNEIYAAALSFKAGGIAQWGLVAVAGGDDFAISREFVGSTGNLRICESGGNVGVGITNPIRKLHVGGDDTLGSLIITPSTGTANNDAELILGENDTYTYGMSLKYDGGTNELYVYGYANGTIYGPHLTIERDGQVGINKADPTYDLDVDGTVAMTGLRLTTGATNGLVLTSNASGTGSWQAVGSDNDWERGTPDSVLFTANHLGLCRGDPGNVLHGSNVYTHTNFGNACTTGIAGDNQSYNTISGGYRNKADSNYSAVIGGSRNRAQGSYSVTCGGYINTARGQRSFVGGGYSNETNYDYSVVVGGNDNTADSTYCFVGGGYLNSASGYRTFVGGGYSNEATNNYAACVSGYNNRASGLYSFAGGGYSNLASGSYAVVAGGYDNTASGSYSFAGGRRARAYNTGSFVWADGTNADFASTGSDQFLIRASGGVGIGTTSPTSALHVSGGAGSVDLLVEADTDNSGEDDQPSITLSQDGGGVEGKLGYFDGTNQLTLKNLYDDALILGTNDAPQVTIHGNGRVDFSDLIRIQDNTWPSSGSGMELAYDSTENRGYIQVYDRSGSTWGTLYLGNGNVGIGTTTPAAKLHVYSNSDTAAIFRGNIVVQNTSGVAVVEIGEGLDYSEGFNVSGHADINPGAVLIIDPDQAGALKLSDKSYDSKVAGIVAGANGLGTGVRLGAGKFDYDVALAGRVYCNVDATESEVEPGDLLTTSSTPGYAMKVADYELAQGAILGKAMQNLSKGKKGKILVLVTLQ